MHFSHNPICIGKNSVSLFLSLMFVNASPADYNVAETESSLLYAGRVKTVKNSASKGGGNPEEIKKLQKQLAMMKKKLQEQNAK